MFDGPTTVDVDWDDGPGIVIDLSAVYSDRDALPLVMMAATHWLTAVLQRAANRRVIQVIDEAWAAVLHGARHFQSSLKLARTYGVSTWLVCHRPSDLTAQADDGTADAKIAAGLLSDIQTRVLLRQPADQVAVAADLFGLTERESRASSANSSEAGPCGGSNSEVRSSRTSSPTSGTTPVRHRRRHDHLNRTSRDARTHRPTLEHRPTSSTAPTSPRSSTSTPTRRRRGPPADAGTARSPTTTTTTPRSPCTPTTTATNAGAAGPATTPTAATPSTSSWSPSTPTGRTPSTSSPPAPD